MDLRIKDKVYLVTGGGSGIGGGISVALAREGAIPVILGRSPLQKSFRAEVRALQPLMHFIQIELTDEQACADAVQEAVSMYGRIDGLINCAGGNDNVSLETGVEAFRVSLERNLVHYYTMAHYCIGELKKSKGSILNVSSKTALTGQGGTSGYTAAKGAILSLTREWAASYLGLIGAGIPLIILYFCYNNVVTYVYTKFSVLLGVVDFIPVGQIYQTLVPVALALGIGIGLVGSFITTRKHLKV